MTYRHDGKQVLCKDGRRGSVGLVMKYRKGWQYFVHFPEGGVEVLSRSDFDYIKTK